MAVSYPLDTSGLATTNLVSNELQSVQPPADINNATFIVPRAAPFFIEGMEIYTGPNKTGTKLVENIDFFFAHKFVAGSVHLGRMLYGSIVFTNSNYTGNVYLNYQTLGGDFTIDDAGVVERITNLLYRDIRFVTWDQIEGVPSAFPPDAHLHQVNDIKTMDDINEALLSIASALIGETGGTGTESQAFALIVAHLSNTTSAHTAAAVGLGNVRNYNVATEADALALRNDRYMTPSVTGYLIARYIANQNLGDIRNRLTTAENDINNLETLTQSLNLALNDTNVELAQLANQLTSYHQEIETINQNINEVWDLANVANTTANSALGQVAAVQSNAEEMINRAYDVLYVANAIYPAGQYMVILPVGSKIMVTMIGAGAGSGRYYNIDSDGVRLGAHPEKGEDSILYFAGTRETPHEPLPLLIAGGGQPGVNSYGAIGAVPGGIGGKAMRFRADRIRVTDIVNVNTATDYVLGGVSENGTNGTGGDTNNPDVAVAGVGGFFINASGDYYRDVYGKGLGGTQRAGLGGSGAKWNIIVDNNSTNDIRLVISVGRAGFSARNGDPDAAIQLLRSNGVAFTQLVN